MTPAAIKKRSTRRILTVAIATASLSVLAAPAAVSQPAAGNRSTFAGSVIGSDGFAIHDSALTVQLKNVAGRTRSVPVGPDGSFRATVQPGPYTLALVGRVYDDLSVSVKSDNGALDLSGSRYTSLTLPTATLTARVEDSRGQPVAGAGVALASPGCSRSGFNIAFQLNVSGTWNEGGAAPAVTGDNGVATRTVLPCAAKTTYAITPPAATGLTATSVVVDPHTGDVSVPVALPVPLADLSQQDGLYEINQTWSAHTIDYNNDGLEDVWIGYHQRSGKLWRNNGDGTYTQVAKDAWPADNPDGTSTDRHDCNWADVDGNGLIDAACAAGRDSQNYVKPANRDNELWLQLTPGNFTEVGTQWGLADQCGRGRHLVFLDANKDGWPDLFVGNEEPRDDPTDPCRDPANHLPNFRSKFYLNMHGTGFRYAPNFFDPGYIGQRCAQTLDFNSDGWPDLLTCNTNSEPPSLYRNNHGTGFTLVSAQKGLTTAVDDVSIIDFDGDGDVDLVTASADGFYYQLNRNGTFGPRVPIYVPHANGSVESVAVGDIDGDGDLDVYAMFGRLNINTPNADDLVLLKTPAGYVPQPVPPANNHADHVIPLHPDGPDQPAQFLVMNGYQSGEPHSPGGPIQVITSAS